MYIFKIYYIFKKSDLIYIVNFKFNMEFDLTQTFIDTLNALNYKVIDTISSEVSQERGKLEDFIFFIQFWKWINYSKKVKYQSLNSLRNR